MIDKKKLLSDNEGVYYTDKNGKNPLVINDNHKEVIDAAISILDLQLRSAPFQVNDSSDSINFLRLKLQQKEREVFAVMFLDTMHNLIEYDEMFAGTINAASVWPREIAKKALLLNAGAIVISHNHPSGEERPSDADKNITDQIKQSLNLFDIRLLDHIIIAGDKSFSFTANGLNWG
jgi:DNA repair protein RadC